MQSMKSLLSRRTIQGLSLAAALCLALMPATVEAKGGFSSSGSHSSHSSSSSSSKPSSSGGYGSPSQGSTSKPSSGSGYGSPSQSAPDKSGPSSGSSYGSPSLSTTTPAAGAAGGSVSGLGSANDKAVSQQSSKASLDAYKASKAPPAANWQPRPDANWSRPSYVPSTPAFYGSGSSGISGLVWWMMIENLADHAVMATLMSHRDSDDYRAWRREADHQAAENAELRGRLDEMDRKLAQEGQASALASPPVSESHPLRNVLVIVLIGGGLYGAYRVFSRRRA
jgi:hypothetical protein